MKKKQKIKAYYYLLGMLNKFLRRNSRRGNFPQPQKGKLKQHAANCLVDGLY